MKSVLWTILFATFSFMFACGAASTQDTDSTPVAASSSETDATLREVQSTGLTEVPPEFIKDANYRVDDIRVRATAANEEIDELANSEAVSWWTAMDSRRIYTRLETVSRLARGEDLYPGDEHATTADEAVELMNVMLSLCYTILENLERNARLYRDGVTPLEFEGNCTQWIYESLGGAEIFPSP